MATKQVENIEELKDQINKEFGEGSIMDGELSVKDVETFSSGCLELDIALGVGGFPKGRIIEVYGREGGGKTTITLHAAASVQRTGGRVAFIDAEHALDREYANTIGVDTSTLLISQPNYGEQALNIIEKLVESTLVDLIILDSVASLVPKAELDGELEDHHIGAQAKMMSKFLRKLATKASKTNTTIIFTNQIREKLGGLSFGSNESTPGGKALKFYSSVRMDVRNIGLLRSSGKDKEILGHKVQAKIVKNKVAPPFRIAGFEIHYDGRGINRPSSLLNLGLDHGLVSKNGNFFIVGKTNMGNGKNNAIAYLYNHPELMDELESSIMEKINGITEAEIQTG